MASNQYMNFPNPYQGSNLGTQPSYPYAQPSNPYASPPGTVPQQPSIGDPGSAYYNVGGWTRIPGAYTGPTVDPGFTSEYLNMLQSQIGQGAPPFDLRTVLPSTGQVTAPGQLNAPLTPLLQQLQQFYMGQGGGPNQFTLPMFNSITQAMQLPIQENLANLQEQFGSRGALGSSEMARAMSDYLTQTSAQQQALLGNLTLQALPLEQQAGAMLQGLDQQAIQNMMQEFMRTSPYYSPLLPLQAQAALTFPPIYQKGGGIASGSASQAGQIVAAILGALK